MYDKNGKLIPEKGDLSMKTLKYVWDNAIDNSFAQTDRRIQTAQRLKKIRVDNRLTQKELCEKIDVVLTTYAGYEQGRHDIPTEIIARIATLFDISADYIICLTDNPKGLFAEENSASHKAPRGRRQARKAVVRVKARNN